MRGYFVGIGGQKCGTSWLAKYLYSHMDVLSNPVKEMHVFDWMFRPDITRDVPAGYRRQIAGLKTQLATVEAARRRESDQGRTRGAFARRAQLVAREEVLAIVTCTDRRVALERYRQYFASRVGDDDVAFGEITPAYATLPADGFTTILSAYPDARFLFLLRDPVDRMASWLRHLARARTGVDIDHHFDDLLADDGTVARSAYERTLASLDAAVPPEQVLTVFYEDLFDPNDESTLREITAFLDITFVPVDRSVTVNSTEGWTMSPAQARRTVERYATTYAAIASRFGRAPARWQERLALL
jgi:hypothetical protein